MVKTMVKPALSYKSQLNLLESRGLVIEDFDYALNTLKRVNYYKLSGFSLSLRDGNKFHEGITFDKIYKLYVFNKRLSMILIDLIESVEGVMKSQLAYYCAHNHGPLGYLDSQYFRDVDKHLCFVELCKKNTMRQRHLVFVKHNLKKYGELPIWVLVEILTFGEISKVYGNLKSIDQTRISKDVFGIVSNKLRNWLEVLTIVRNKCAHHDRLYNTYLSVSLNLYSDIKDQGINNRSYFAIFIVLRKLILKEEQWTRAMSELERLLNDYTDVVDLKRLGFKANWKDHLLNS